MAEDRGIQIDTQALIPIVIRGDRARLKQVIVNLLANAIRFTPRGGMVTLRSSQSSLYSVLEVCDTVLESPRRRCRMYSIDSFESMKRAHARTAAPAWDCRSRNPSAQRTARSFKSIAKWEGQLLLPDVSTIAKGVIQRAAQALRSEHANDGTRSHWRRISARCAAPTLFVLRN